MPAFHCPLGSVYYDDEPCIDCGLCLAQTESERVEAAKKMREYIRARGAGAPGRPQKIAVCGKGGAGKSTLVVLLARALRRKDYRLLVVDSDDSNPGLSRLLGLESPARPLSSLLERFAPGEGEPDASWLKAERISLESIPREFVSSAPGMKFLTAGKIIDPFQGCACSIADLARDFLQKLSLASGEITLMDMEAGVESFGRGVERGADTVLIAVEPSFDSLALAGKILYLAEGIGIRNTMAILNKVPSPRIESRMREELAKQEVRIAGAVSLDSRLRESALAGGKLPEGTEAETIVRKIVESIFLEVSGGTGEEE